MSFNSNIPQPNDLLSSSQDDLLQNFFSLKAAIDVNHGTFGAADEGMHKWASIPVDQVPTNPVPIAADLVVKCATSRFTNLPEATYQRTGGVALFPFTVKSSILNTDYQGGWATLGGNNLIMKWGTISCTGTGIFEFPFGNGTPLFSATPYHMTVVTLAPLGFSTDVNAKLINIVSATTFSVNCTRRTTNADALVPFMWLAIGPT